MNNIDDPATKIAPLDKLGWLSEQPQDFVDWVARSGSWRTFSAGQFLYHAGEPSDGLYGLGSGALEITFPLIADEPIAVYRAEIGFWVGDTAELAEKPRIVSMAAATNSSVFHLPSRAINSLLRANPEHWRSFYALTSRNFVLAMTILSETLALTVRARVCRRLLEWGIQSADIEITQNEFAKALGVARGTLSRCLTDLEAQGAIELHYRGVRLLDPDLLATYVNEQ